MKSAKLKVKNAVAEYKRLFAEDYAIVVDGVAMKRSLTKDEFASVQGTQTEMRALYEIPETLYNLILGALDSEELLWFKMGIKGNENQGGRWFAKTYPEFALPEKI